MGEPLRTKIPWNSGWSLLAWGFDSAGKDETEGYRVVVVDLDESQELIDQLRSNGHIVVCYFSVGTIETFRDDVENNRDDWRSIAAGDMAEWDETWVDITSQKTKDLQKFRFEKAKAKRCHAVEPDNVDCHQNSECWENIKSIKNEQEARVAQIAFNTWQTETAHALGLSIALKNSLDLVKDLVDKYDFTINESCQRWGECNLLFPFYAQNKLIANVEYNAGPSSCDESAKHFLSTKYCEGTSNLCKKPWTNCFPKGVRGKVWLPSYPTAWADLTESYGAKDVREGKQVLLVDLDRDKNDIANWVSIGHTLICSFSAGALENSRPDHSAAWDSLVLDMGAKSLDGLPWFDLRNPEALILLIGQRIEKASNLGCHGVLLTHLNCADHPSCVTAHGRSIQAVEGLVEAYAARLAQYTSMWRLVLGVKSSLTLSLAKPDLLDFTLTENCASDNFCQDFQAGFVDQDKPVFNVEFDSPNCTLADLYNASTKFCQGTYDLQMCDAGTTFTSCFPDVVVTPWPTPAPYNFGDEDEDGGLGAGYVVLIIALVLAVVGFTVFLFAKLRNRADK